MVFLDKVWVTQQETPGVAGLQQELVPEPCNGTSYSAESIGNAPVIDLTLDAALSACWGQRQAAGILTALLHSICMLLFQQRKINFFSRHAPQIWRIDFGGKLAYGI